jgi:hypothetical protein
MRYLLALLLTGCTYVTVVAPVDVADDAPVDTAPDVQDTAPAPDSLASPPDVAPTPEIALQPDLTASPDANPPQCPYGCDDGIVCTKDRCGDSGCEHIPQQMFCGWPPGCNGAYCSEYSGCVVEPYGCDKKKP